MSEHICPACHGTQGGVWTWDDGYGIRHEDWVSCSTCNGKGKVPWEPWPAEDWRNVPADHPDHDRLMDLMPSSRFRCTGCGLTWAADDLLQVQPDGHDACPNPEHDDVDDPPLERVA